LLSNDIGGPNGIRHTDVFSSAHCLIRLPFEGLALAGYPEVTRRIGANAPH